ncbi:hypothetical protein [Wenxinia marina]|uniref:Wenxma_21, whole genome shotgun sequence n=1 Tax=Wenxinia marina DSM 24838 TaxID=1123501 RepID=A0A0D0Q8Z1_9RHOB|nr:hypothetical protein [Wenxinia marina]KIQ67558.1 hypothetical protein Wenmar_03983 [Wenxinia marina DSM 24838]GGL68476.1 hypothetical protein GCM10011392_23740 [Wenxinia marina]
MKIIKAIALLPVAALVSACEVGADKAADFGPIDASGNLSNMVAGIWVDPNGCDHWIIDDGVEGYLSERLTPDGRPVCSGVGAPTTVVGPFQSTSGFPDLL